MERRRTVGGSKYAVRRIHLLFAHLSASHSAAGCRVRRMKMSAPEQQQQQQQSSVCSRVPCAAVARLCLLVCVRVS